VPAGQVFCVALEEALLHQCPTEHARQDALLEAPVLALKRPAAQKRQVALLVAPTVVL
jgi:hypothetical protein